MKICLVNEYDEIIGYKDRDDRNQHDIIRVSALWLYNSNNEILIAQRALDKVNDPGKWGPAVAGTVEEGESYLSNILKEAQEEIGLTISENDVVIGPHRLNKTSHTYFCQYFYCKTDLAIEHFRLQKEEVEALQWIQLNALKQWFAKRPQDFTPSLEASLQQFADYLVGNPE